MYRTYIMIYGIFLNSKSEVITIYVVFDSCDNDNYLHIHKFCLLTNLYYLFSPRVCLLMVPPSRGIWTRYVQHSGLVTLKKCHAVDNRQRDFSNFRLCPDPHITRHCNAFLVVNCWILFATDIRRKSSATSQREYQHHPLKMPWAWLAYRVLRSGGRMCP